VNQQNSLFGEDDADSPAIPGADITFLRGALTSGFADSAFVELQQQVDWRQEHILMMGNSIPLPRLTAWFGDPGRNYTYSAIAMSASPWTPMLSMIRGLVEGLSGEQFNSVLCNLYRSGEDGLAWHSDDEPELGSKPTIASVNLGQARRFLFRRRDDHSVKTEFLLGHGDVLIMRGLTQALCEHSVPKTKKHLGPRINLTFRRIEQ
jgi:alkylated DNA repair dioxygenase AlkB